MRALTEAEHSLPVTFLVADVARLARKRFEQLARERQLGLTRAQAAVLHYLARQEGLRQASLAQAMDIEPITLVRLLDRLQEQGLIERRADPSDRRAYRLYTTEASRPLLEESRALSAQMFEDAQAGLSPEDREKLHGALSVIRGNLIERLNEGSDGPTVARKAGVRHG